MPRNISYALFPAVLYILCGLIPGLCKITPAFQLWKDYKIAAVSRDVPEESVLALFGQAGVSGVICRTANTPENLISAALIPDCFSEKSYAAKKQRYFTDKEKNWQLFYIPDAYAPAAETVLAAASFPWWFESRQPFPWLPPVCAAAAFAVFFLLSKKKGIFSLAALPVMYFSFCFPFYSVCIGAALELYVLYTLQHIYDRRGLRRFVRTQPLVCITAVCACLLYASADIRIFCCSPLVWAAPAAVFLFFRHYRSASSDTGGTPLFKPVSIVPAHRTRIASNRPVLLLFVPAALSGVFLILLLAGGTVRTTDDANRLSIPCRVRYTEHRNFSVQACMELYTDGRTAGLPDLGSFVAYRWASDIFPFRKIGTDAELAPFPEPGETVTAPHYAIADGKIAKTETEKYIFNDAYILSVLAAAEHMNASSLERLFVRQGAFFAADYIIPGSSRSEYFLNAKLFSILCISLGSIIIHLIRRNTYGSC